MKAHNLSFFCGDKENIYCHLSVDKASTWPITVSINGNQNNRHNTPYINIYLKTYRELIAFKNSMLGAFDKVMRERYVWGEERTDA